MVLTPGASQGDDELMIFSFFLNKLGGMLVVLFVTLVAL